MASTADDVEAKDSVVAPMPDAADAGSHNGSAVDKPEAPCIGLCVTHTPLQALSTFVFGYVCIAVIVIGRSFIINLL